MLQICLILLLGLVLIVVAAEFFTNGVEWLGQRLGLSEGIVGSILAAVGTALPETLIPVIAVLWFREDGAVEVGIGAIAGAPFMLSTLTLSMCGLSMFFFAKRGVRPTALTLNRRLLARDLRFFILAYSIAVVASFASSLPILRWILAATLLCLYPVYVFLTFKGENELGSEPEKLHLAKLTKLESNNLVLIICQVLLGLAGIVGGAGIFVQNIEQLGKIIGFAPIFLSLIVSPIATELPEKINSVLWARRGKDTLALANITGALVFQACFPVAFGVAFTAWNLDAKTLATAGVAIFSAIIYQELIRKDKLRPVHLMLGAVAYAVVVGILIATDTVEPS